MTNLIYILTDHSSSLCFIDSPLSCYATTDDLFKGKGPLTTSYSNVHLNRTSSSGTVSKAVIAAYPLVSTNSVPDLKDKDKG